jgi:hypothetical protein
MPSRNGPASLAERRSGNSGVRLFTVPSEAQQNPGKACSKPVVGIFGRAKIREHAATSGGKIAPHIK